VLHQLAGRGFKGTALGDLSYRGQRLSKAGEALGITIQPSAGGHGGTFIPEGIRWVVENRDHYVRDVTLGEDDSRIRTRLGGMARIRSAALNILRANGVQNVSQALYINALNLNRLLALGSS
jgi:hypothetical protein